MDILLLELVGTIVLISLFKFSISLDIIAPSQSLLDGQTLVSQDGSFALGFFSPGISKNRYLGIWYQLDPKTVVWVANRQNPINGASGVLKINSTGTPIILGESKTVVWSAPNMTREVQDPILQLLDSGNLVLRSQNDGTSGSYLWQSFDYPCDTLLPGMKLGWDLKTGLDRHLTSWKSPDDPSPGDFTWGIELHSNPERNTWKGSKKYFRGGPWNGVGFSGGQALRPNPIFEDEFVLSKEEVYYTYNLKNKSVFIRVLVNQTGYNRQRYTLNKVTQTWMLYSSEPSDYCDTYSLCGAYGKCIISESPVCQCLDGFKPKSLERWNLMDWAQGCVRNKPLNCSGGDGFVKFSGLKLPDATHSWISQTMALGECRDKCLQNCSCTAYTNLDIRDGGSGCAMWFDDLTDMRQFPAGGQELYIRMSASEVAKDETRRNIAVIISTTVAIAVGMVIISYYIHRRRKKLKDRTESCWKKDQNSDKQKQDMQLPMFDLETIANATRNFSNNNRLGEGGFGAVYKGTLADGQEIAVKRLSRSSGQGQHEFKNEVILIAKLQHRNLVRLLGFCIQGDERMLVYEYMSKKSLDIFIFDQTNGKLLDWPMRFRIINGIARGLLYLHQDSRLRIIHRDLKASNILLDNELNPKISDFGLARTFGEDQSEGKTKRLVGTYGYMAPEYATDGLFSMKSDIFSFGIVMLEIISGKKSKGFYHPNNSLNLIGYAWRLWKEGKSLELVDKLLGESWDLSEVTRCIHISLLCVQQHPEDRPSMASAVLMLGSETALLPQPKQPGFFMDAGPVNAHSSSSKPGSCSTNDITISLLEAR